MYCFRKIIVIFSISRNSIYFILYPFSSAKIIVIDDLRIAIILIRYKWKKGFEKRRLAMVFIRYKRIFDWAIGIWLLKFIYNSYRICFSLLYIRTHWVCCIHSYAKINLSRCTFIFKLFFKIFFFLFHIIIDFI